LVASTLRADDTDSGTTSRAARQQAIAAIPFDQLNPQTSQLIRQLVQNASVFRRLPITTIQSDPDVYLFLVRYPEVVVDTWRLMGISNMTAQRTGQYTLSGNDGAGTTCSVDLVYGTPNLHVFLVNGSYSGPRLLKSITGKCVVVLQSAYQRGSDGLPQATSCMDVFLVVDNVAADWAARTLHPMFGGVADHNFVESLGFLEKMSRTTVENGPGIQGMSNKLTGVHPEVRARFSHIAGIVSERYGMSEASPQMRVVRPSHYQIHSGAEGDAEPAR
jgi:hypothetical protein